MWTRCSQDCQCQRSRPASCAKRKLGVNRSPHKLSLIASIVSVRRRSPGMGAARNPRRWLSMARIHRGSPPGSLAEQISLIVSEPLITARRRCQVRVKASPSFSLQAIHPWEPRRVKRSSGPDLESCLGCLGQWSLVTAAAAAALFFFPFPAEPTQQRHPFLGRQGSG